VTASKIKKKCVRKFVLNGRRVSEGCSSWFQTASHTDCLLLFTLHPLSADHAPAHAMMLGVDDDGDLVPRRQTPLFKCSSNVRWILHRRERRKKNWWSSLAQRQGLAYVYPTNLFGESMALCLRHMSPCIPSPVACCAFLHGRVVRLSRSSGLCQTFARLRFGIRENGRCYSGILLLDK